MFGFISAGLIAVSSVLFLVFVWFLWKKIESGSTYFHVTWIISAITILFNVIVGNVIVIGKKLLPLQIIDYVTLLYIEVAIVSAICGASELFFADTRWLIFAIIAIVWVVFVIILSIKKKAITREAVSQVELKPLANDTITLNKAEYQALLDRIADLENQLANK